MGPILSRIKLALSTTCEISVLLLLLCSHQSVELTPIEHHGVVYIGGVVFKGAFGDGYLTSLSPFS